MILTYIVMDVYNNFVWRWNFDVLNTGTLSPSERWALSGHWLKGGYVGFNSTRDLLRYRVGKRGRKNDCVVALFFNQRIEGKRVIVLLSSGPFNDGTGPRRRRMSSWLWRKPRHFFPLALHAMQCQMPAWSSGASLLDYVAKGGPTSTGRELLMC